MNKAVAIPYIIALVIGIIVLAFIAYWVYKSISSPILSLEECKSRVINWCTQCAAAGWPDEQARMKMPDELRECANKYFGGVWGDNDCCGSSDTCGNNKGDCEAFLGKYA
ncbi:MAG: hypothetical protein DRP00_03795 [Candidatus Aenigmatarchaeota archaeon]|nr:MAG: hypothetical protein DRP00_03795 [Candidatus Aenigmarchaeota archaeon]